MQYSKNSAGWLGRVAHRYWIGSLTALALVINFDISGAGASTLYDAAQGMLPDVTPWTWRYRATGSGVAAMEVVSGAFRLDTTSWSDKAGYNYGGLFEPPTVLDSALGFTLDFSAQVMAENHSSDDRSGFSVIVLDSAAKGVELSLWTDEVFVKNADFTPLYFSRSESESAALSTQSAQRSYSLAFSGAGYSLSIDGSPKFAGGLRNYAAAALAHSDLLAYGVYSHPNYIFFGDNMSSTDADIRLGSIALVPEPDEWAFMLAGLGCIGAAIRRRNARRRMGRIWSS